MGITIITVIKCFFISVALSERSLGNLPLLPRFQQNPVDYLKSPANHPQQFSSERDFASFVGCKLAANTPWVSRVLGFFLGGWGGDLSLRQTQKGAGEVPDVPKSPKICCVHPARGQDVGTALAALSQWMPVMGSEMGEGEQGSAELMLG